MIEIRHAQKDIAFDLAPGAKVRLSLLSPAFETEGFVKGFTFPMQLMDSDTNRVLLEHWYRAANPAERSDISVNVWLFGSFFTTANLKYMGGLKGNFSASVIIPTADLLEQFSGKMMNTFNLGGTRNFDNILSFSDPLDLDAYMDDFTGTIDETDYVFAPIKNTFAANDQEMQEGNAGAYPWHNVINYYDGHGNYYRWTLSATTLPTAGNPYVRFMFFTPLPYLVWVWREMFDEMGWTIGGDIVNNTEVQQLVIVSNYVFNVWLSEDLVANAGGDDRYHLKFTMPEDLTAVEFLIESMRRFNGFFTFSENEASASFTSRKSLLSTTNVIDLTGRAQIEPRIKYSEFRGRIMFFTPDDNDELIKENPNIPDDPLIYDYQTRDDLLPGSEGDIARVIDEGRYYQYTKDDFGISYSWKPYAHDLHKLETDPKGESTELYYSGTAMTKEEDDNSHASGAREWLIPEMKVRAKVAVNDWHKIGQNEARLRLLFYRGWQHDSKESSGSGSGSGPGSDPSQYPMLTNDVYDYAGNVIEGATMAERVAGSGGIWETWYQDWDNFLKNAKVYTRFIELHIDEVMNFDFTQKVRIEGVDHIVRQLDIEFTAEGMGMAKLELWTVQR